MTGTEKAIKALQDYWDATDEMTKDEFDRLGNITVRCGVSNLQIDMVKRALQEATELKPCPLCGGKAKIEDLGMYREPTWIVRCGQCGCSTGRIQVLAAKAIAAWNRRV